MKKYAVIVAGGSGQRMESAIPKQFLLLHDKPVIWYTINAFLNAFEDIRIILVLQEDKMDEAATLLGASSKYVSMVPGGATRFHSVQNGLQQVNSGDGIIFVHDAVRCLVSPALIRRCYDQACLKGSAIPAIAVTDSIRMVDEEKNFALDRRNVRIIQTPQTFLSRLLLPAYQQPFSAQFTDDASVVEAFGQQVHLIEGEVNNIKLTRPIDLVLAKHVLTN